MTASLLEKLRREMDGAQPYTSCSLTIGSSGQSCAGERRCLRPDHCMTNNQDGLLQAGVYRSTRPVPSSE